MVFVFFFDLLDFCWALLARCGSFLKRSCCSVFLLIHVHSFIDADARYQVWGTSEEWWRLPVARLLPSNSLVPKCLMRWEDMKLSPRLVDHESKSANMYEYLTFAHPREMLEQKSSTVVQTRTPQAPMNQVGSRLEFTDLFFVPFFFDPC